jgi:hypothetical protein
MTLITLTVVTGPFKINGVPLRRVNARYVIATSTSVEVKGLDVRHPLPYVVTIADNNRAEQGPGQGLRNRLLGR